MIEVRTQLPRVYYNESRDFQLLGRLFEAVLNYAKMNSDFIENLYSLNVTDARLINLMAKTIGFESKHEYDVSNLKVICGCFYDIIKYKGTKLGIEKAIAALLNAQGIDNEFDVETHYDTRHVDIFMPSKAKDVVLLKDLFDYILPVGWSYSITSGIAGDLTRFSTIVVPESVVSPVETPTSALDKVAKLSVRFVPNTSNIWKDNTYYKFVAQEGSTPAHYELLGMQPEDWDSAYTSYYVSDSQETSVGIISLEEADE